MYVEYACYDEILLDEIRKKTFQAIDLGANGISVPVAFVSSIVDFLPDGTVLSCPVDYPNGHGDTDLRIHNALRAHYYGANTIDIVVSLFMYYHKQKNFIRDVDALMTLCDDKKMTPRFIIDHRKLVKLDDFYKILKVLENFSIEYIFCSTGMYSEAPVDNIILCNSAQTNYYFKAIANGNFYLKDHVSHVENANIYGMRFNNIKALERCLAGV